MQQSRMRSDHELVCSGDRLRFVEPFIHWKIVDPSKVGQRVSWMKYHLGVTHVETDVSGLVSRTHAGNAREKGS